MPGAEVSPPMIATAKALSPMIVPICGATLRRGASSTPARPARMAESAYEAMTARGMLMPMSPAASGSQATALSCLPYEVRW
jgi:hypothetical protein